MKYMVWHGVNLSVNGGYRLQLQICVVIVNVFNPRHTYAARVTVLFCMCVCLSITTFFATMCNEIVI